MNHRKIEWDLVIQKNEVIDLLHQAILSPERPPSKQKKIKGQIIGDKFELAINRSLIWGSAFRKEIEVNGSLFESKEGSRITASFKVCTPYRYVNLNSRKLSIIVPSLVLSWLGLAFVHFWIKGLSFLDYLLIPAFIVTCTILILGFKRYLTIDDKFKEIIGLFEKTFEKHKVKES